MKPNRSTFVVRLMGGPLAWALFLVLLSPVRGWGAAPLLKDLGNGIVQETTSGRMWQKTRSHSLKSLAAARAYVKKLRLGGHDDWRLPTIYELYDLRYLFDVKRAGDIHIRLDGNYWSEDRKGEGMAGSWEIGDQCGPTRHYYKKNWGFVRAVRP